MAVSLSNISLPDRYELRGHLATGGMAGVWKAHDALLGRDVAVKILSPHLAQDEQARRRFTREARTAAGLSNHPHVVTIYDVGQHEGASFIVMELMRGGNVADRLKAGGPPEHATSLQWLSEAAAALDSAHDEGIVHRDVKPANLLLDERDRLAIADFGIARVAMEDQLTSTGIVLGTAAYIAPEQAAGEPVTAASDRYALAVVAFELLTGAKPFQAENFAAQARMQVEDPPPRPTEVDPSLPRAVDDVLLRGLAKDPHDRWPSATAMVEALARALEGQPTRPTAPLAGSAAAGSAPTAAAPAGSAAAAPRSRHTAWLILAAIAAAAIALALILGSGGGDGSEPASDRPEPTPQAEKPKEKKQEDKAEATPEPTATATATPAPAGGDPRALQIAGFEANNAGDYQTGLDRSLAAVEACGDRRELDPCGYALYEVGRAYVGLGQPAEAIPYLEQRLDLYGDNDSGDVSQLLEQARGATGASEPGKGKAKAKGHDKGD